MSHKKGATIDAHFHKPVKRVIHNTQEVLIVRRGRLLCDLYDRKQRFLQSSTLEEGDMIVLLDGGHGFSALEDLELIEIKQGPFLGDNDKTRFKPSSAES
jgi:mannose-6-phosphate isomerase-like protein (cupin superfamily)